MRIVELTLPPTRQSAGTILRKAGYQPLGKGAFSKVWVRPGQPFALKLFAATDAAYMAFANLAQEHPNPHFPIIRGRPIKVTDQYNAVRIEVLQPPTTRWWRLIRACGEYLEALELIDAGVDFNYNNTKAKRFQFSNRSLAQAIDLIYQNIMQGNRQMLNDIDIRNCRVRGNILVFIDPVGWGGGPTVFGNPAAIAANEHAEIFPTKDEEKAISQDNAMKRRVRVRDLWTIDMPGNDSTYPALSGMGV